MLEGGKYLNTEQNEENGSEVQEEEFYNFRVVWV